jgi:hypothetical protein
MRIDSSGNVGIGTSSPSGYGKLSVNGNVILGPYTRNQAGTQYIGIATAGDPAADDRASINFTTVAGASSSNSFITFSTNNYGVSSGERMRIDSSGNVGIGTSSPTSRLHVYGATNSQLTLQTSSNSAYVGNISGSMEIQSADIIKFNTGGATERARIDTSGNLLVGKTSAGTSNTGFEVTPASGVARINLTSSGTGVQTKIAFYNNSGTYTGEIFTGSGTSTTYSTASDYRLKEDVQPMTGALARNALLNPVKYKWKIDGREGEGFIAHQLQGQFPSAVLGEKDAVDADGNPVYQGIGTGPLDGHFAACVNELQAIIQEQQALITALTTRITALESN